MDDGRGSRQVGTPDLTSSQPDDATLLASVIARRRMTRRFTADGPQPLTADVVVEWCDLARRAPSAGFAQGVHLLVRSEVEATLDALGASEWFAHRQPGVLSASVAVLVLADREAYVARYRESDKTGHGLETSDGWRIPYWLTDAAMAAQNLLLIAEAAGRGALFIGVFRDPRPALSGWDVPESVDCVGVILLGDRAVDDRPSGTPTRRTRQPRDTVVHLDRW
jgi:nitroreductase